MKRILFITFMAICASFAIIAQNYRYQELFRNEKLGIFHTVKTGDLVPGGHYLLIDNYTNNNLRVTYKAKVRVVNKVSRTYRDFTYTKTVYAKPKDSFLDHFYDTTEVMNHIISISKDAYFENYCNLMLMDFELINFGVENKNYETTY